jgi:hypothetical protein
VTERSESARHRAAHLLAVAGDLAGRASQRVAAAGGATLSGDRWVEWGFCLARVPSGRGNVLDFGADIGFLSFSAAQRGHEVVAFDRMPSALEYEHPRVRSIQGDILTHDFGAERFDLVINCSSIEHVGLPGRYESFAREDGDLEAMAILRGLLTPEGQMLLTVPVGQDGVFPPYHRVYGDTRLQRLLDGFGVIEQQYWHKAGERWVATNREVALAEQSSERFYALGLFVLGAG